MISVFFQHFEEYHGILITVLLYHIWRISVSAALKLLIRTVS